MFSIYDYDGRIFRNTLEELYKVKPVSDSQAALKSKAEMLKHSSAMPASEKLIPDNSALKAYKELIHASPKEELHHAFEIMQEDFQALDEDQTVYEALQIILEGDQDVLPVLNKQNRIVGLFSYRQVIQGLLSEGQEQPNFRILPVKAFLAGKVITAEPVTSIRRIAAVMSQYHQPIIPIVDAYDAMVGLVTLSELTQAMANEPPLSIWT
jgi:CBS domain-containing protein